MKQESGATSIKWCSNTSKILIQSRKKCSPSKIRHRFSHKLSSRRKPQNISCYSSKNREWAIRYNSSPRLSSRRKPQNISCYWAVRYKSSPRLRCRRKPQNILCYSSRNRKGLRLNANDRPCSRQERISLHLAWSQRFEGVANEVLMIEVYLEHS